MTSQAKALRAAIHTRGTIVKSTDGALGLTVTVRTTAKADQIEQLAQAAGAQVWSRKVGKRRWNTSTVGPAREIRSQAITLVIVGADAEQDAYLAH